MAAHLEVLVHSDNPNTAMAFNLPDMHEQQPIIGALQQTHLSCHHNMNGLHPREELLARLKYGTTSNNDGCNSSNKSN